ncbi:hypothetical protein A2364_03735 [candidate division WWE3 bacterium RIFOXYB1_FULL_43_12]|nr:MAG: hypothetical protein A2364_03735 [candidate division WWE3 bacterium RIFOXYB1_FULL_43_12]
MPVETVNSIAFEVSQDEKTREETPHGTDSWAIPETKELTTSGAEARAGEVLMDVYKAVPEITGYLLGSKESTPTVIGVDSNGMILFPETGTVVIPYDVSSQERIRMLKQPIKSALDTTDDGWIFTEVIRPETSAGRNRIDTEEDLANLSVRNITERAPLEAKDVKKMTAQVMRHISGALPTDGETSAVELSGEGGVKVKVHTEKDGKGKTILLDENGQKVNLSDYPDDVRNLYESYFHGPASGEEPLGIEAAFPSARGQKLPDELETRIGDFPETEEKVKRNAGKKRHGIYMELEHPAEAVNKMLAAERKERPLQLPANEPGRLPEAFERTGIVPIIIGIEGKFTAFYDEKKNDIILCVRNRENNWTASRLEKIPQEKIESLWAE